MKQSEDARRNPPRQKNTGNGRAAKNGSAASPSSKVPAKKPAPAKTAVPQRAPAKAPAKKPVPAKAAKRPTAKKRRGGLTLINSLLIFVLLACGALIAWRVSEYRHFAEMKAAVVTQDFYAGTRVDGVDVSEMTLAQAQEYFENNIEPKYRGVQVTLDDGTTVTAEQLGYESNLQDVLLAAWSAGRSGTLEERYAQVTARGANGADYAVARTPYREDRVQAFAESVRRRVDVDAVPASIASFNRDTYQFEFAAERAGRKLDRDALVRDVEAALRAGGGSVTMHIDEIAPAQRVSDIESQYGLIAYAITNASSSSSNRLANIKLALSIINGTCLEPGQTFSFNETVGKRTEERGFRMATAYSSGEVTEQVGGGICQVSTTLFNAAVKADLRIDERNAHSLPVHYVDPGKDAAVDWGNKDLKFTNTSSDRVYICCYLTDDKRIRFGMFGRLLPNGETIAVEGVQTGTIDYETKYQLSFEMESGTQRVLQEGKQGCTALAYKVRLDAAGNEIRREELCRSRYKAVDQIIEYGQ